MESAALSMSCKWVVIFIAKPLGNIKTSWTRTTENNKFDSGVPGQILSASQDAQVGKKKKEV